MENLVAWAKKEGANDGGFTARGRSFIATADIPAGTCIFSIPQQLLLHEGRAWTDPQYGRAFTRLKEAVGDDLDRRWTLCLLLLLEKARGVESFWAAYIDALPTSYMDRYRQVLVKEALSLLKGSRLEAGVQYYGSKVKQLGLWRQQLCDLQAELGCPNTLQDGAGGWAMTDEALLWAKSTVWSRAFNIPYLGAPGKAGIALIPFADMLDHSHDRHMAWHTGASGQDPFTFITHTPISKGSTVYSNYGYKSNEELIIGYGFMLEENPAEFYHVCLGIRMDVGDDKEEAMQTRALLSKLGLPTNHYITLARPLPATLLAAMAVCLMPSGQAYELLMSADGPEADSGRAGRAGAAPEPGSIKSVGIGLSATGTSDSADGSSGQVPGTVEVKAAPLQSAQEASCGSQAPSAAKGRQLDLSFRLRLVALGSVRHRLKARLEDGSPDADLELATKEAPGSGAYMALMYRAGQKLIAQKALAALSQEAAAILGEIQQHSRELAASDASRADSSSEARKGGSSNEAAAADISGLRMGAEQAQSAPLIEVLSGSTPWDQGVVCARDIAEGETVAMEPLSQGFSASSSKELILDLAAARCRHLRHSDSGPYRSRVLERLCKLVEVPLAARLLHHDPGAMQIASCLEGTPAEDLLQSAYRRLAEQWASQESALIQRLACAPAVSASPADMLEALAWAEAVVERHAVVDKESGRAAVTYLASAIPQVFRDLTAIAITWGNHEQEEALTLTAAAPLQSGWRLPMRVQMEDAIFENLLLGWGPSAAAHAVKGGKARYAYELGIAPREGLPETPYKMALLTDSAISSTHWLSLSCGQAGILAAMALSLASRDQLTSFGAADVTEAVDAACDSTLALTSEGLQRNADRMSASEETAAKLWGAQQSFGFALLGAKQLMKEARSALKSILRLEREGMQDELGDTSEHTDIHKWAALEYRAAMDKIVGHHLSLLKTGKNRRTSAV